MRDLAVYSAAASALFAGIAVYRRNSHPRWSAFTAGVAVFHALGALMLTVETIGWDR